MKSNIKCDAERCMHNYDGVCDAAVVHVRNSKTSPTSAKCTTYAYRISNSGSRLLMEMGEDMSLDRRDKNEEIPVACGKTDCKHNYDCVCSVGSVHISSPEDNLSHECCCKTYVQK